MGKSLIMLSASLCALAPAMQAAAAQPASEADPAASFEDTIVVTGQKIDRSLQETPDSVAVVPEAEIRRQNILNVKDIIDRTANLTTLDGSRFTIRGIDSLNVSGAGIGDLATIYVDGSPLPRQASFGGPLDVWDLAQVEIFRGPQSTLQGRNALAGAILLETNDPTYEFEGRFRAIAGTEDNLQRYGFAFGGPLIGDQLAFRIAGEVAESDGFITNANTGEETQARDSKLIRGKLLFEPNAVPDLSVLLSYTYDERRVGDDFVSLSTDDPEEDRLSFSLPDFDENIDIQIGVATIDYQFTDELSLTSITALNIVERTFTGDGDRMPEVRAFSEFEGRDETFSEELRLSYDGDRFKGTAGFYYAKQETPEALSDANTSLDLNNDLNLVGVLVGGLGLDVPTAQTVVSFYPNPAVIRAQADNPGEVESYAFFTDFSFDATDKLTFYGGLRWDNEQQVITVGNQVDIITPLPDPNVFAQNPATAPLVPVIIGVNNFLLAEAANATQPTEVAESPTFSALLPKAGIGYDITDDASLAFIVQRGYRSGGIGINAARAESFEFDQEFIWNYELSLRSQWLDNALTVNANAFFIDWTDQQIRIQLSDNVFDTETQNAGSSSIYGFELETRYDATDNLNVQFSAGLAQTEFDEFFVNVNGEIIDLAGNEFAVAPQWTLSGALNWEGDNGLLANLNANYNSASFNRADRPQTIGREIDARTLVNFRAGWRGDKVGIYLTGQNIFDEEYVTSIFPLDTLLPAETPEFARFGDPRTFQIQLEAEF
ncbi:MAG: TonB-dependent receptor [Pseudomonadota bacterium]